MKANRITTTITLSRVAHRFLKHLAVERQVSVRDLVWEAVEDFMEKQREQHRDLVWDAVEGAVEGFVGKQQEQHETQRSRPALRSVRAD